MIRNSEKTAAKNGLKIIQNNFTYKFTIAERNISKLFFFTDSSAQKFVDSLLTEGAKVSCDESSEHFNHCDELPPFYDEQLYKRGQNFFYKHLFGLFFSKCLGLLTVLAIPTILKILMHTKMSSTNMTAYKRYMATIFHMMVWYQSDFKPGSSCSAGLHRISQKDMALTQFGFMGISLVRSKKVGIHEASDEEWEAFLHVWRVIGYLMGIEDR
ncbi:hypothetical protein NQ314_009406 [Rhamnusium bicolor]|uniref:ER-bound oxygenase mpaB/mpaB'/Rubber oxygenase catalytic domain-containing protein n=1 Tax=Rhamnusium bicolor TaxID=1586634 RepID=A0AAV8Y120_9CUCU|nr:hypothetical protein NQ314_009406 [Rhamnusium bicolor]